MNDLTNEYIKITIEEDISQDAERWHSSEDVGMLIIGIECHPSC